ncbi:FKBP-type peptidyl-prolyl cis-trans isomerase [Trichlorobacter lovleyi]|uniref:peptidylprolyl isomerase n=1 Tax=Trichlorobacter lovleyi (strain ATCC BAA-1151 / DSM 17278 / SZ) TaxID=398767 RepID=B3E806_TRIL1|nr:FKBP-type peptidyl-prolyl cis-trans isomerase [Trichlorobacter lovleyi]ACD96579.1 peptidylprolyl isomerase FKBP-type [Trichlorobacter lovleyi SZ]
MDIKLGKYTKLGYQKPNIEVFDEEYQVALDNIRNSLTKWNDSNELTEFGDRITVNYSITRGEKCIQGGQENNITFVVGGDESIEGLECNMVGFKKGERYFLEGNLPQEDSKCEQFQERKVIFEVEIVRIEKLNHPETLDEVLELIDDKELRTASQFEDELKEEIYYHKYKIELSTLVDNILDAVVSNSEIISDESYIKKKVTEMYNQFIDRLEQEDVPIEIYYSQHEISPEDYKVEFLKRAEKEMVLQAVLNEISRVENITVDEKDYLLKKYKYLYENNVNESDIDCDGEFKNDMIRNETIKFLIHANTEA